MALRFSRTGLAGGSGRGQWLAEAINSVLRGVGQVMLQNNAWTGLLFVVAICCNAPIHGAAAVVGAAVGTGVAGLAGADRALIRQGLFGFNGALVAIALPIFVAPGVLLWACVVLAAGGSTVVFAALIALLAPWRMPALTAPFVLTSWCLILAAAGLARLEPTGLAPAAGFPAWAPGTGGVTLATLADGVLNGVGQVFLQENRLTGLIFAVGLLVASRKAFVAALAGALAGGLVAWGMGAAEPAIRAGLFGFNPVLVAIATGAAAPAWDRATCLVATLAVVATPVVQAAASAALAPVGLPALTFPFVVVTWMVLFAGKGFAGFAAPGATDA